MRPMGDTEKIVGFKRLDRRVRAVEQRRQLLSRRSDRLGTNEIVTIHCYCGLAAITPPGS